MVATALTQLLTVKDLSCLSTQHVTFVVAVTSNMYPRAGTTWCQFIVRVPPVYMCQFLHVSDDLWWYTLMVSVHCEWFLLCAFVNPCT